MIKVGVKVEFSRRVTKGGVDSFHQAMSGYPFHTALALAKAAKRRVALRGQPAQRFTGYASGRPRYVSPRYPVTGGEETRSGAKRFDSSAEFHRGVKPGSFNVSGGMWKGLTTMVAGTKVARNRFRGRSEGQGMALRRTGDEPYFDEHGRARPRKTSNARKAATVLKSTGINVLMPTRQDYVGLVEAMTYAAANGVSSSVLAGVDFGVRGRARSALAGAILGNAAIHAINVGPSTSRTVARPIES